MQTRANSSEISLAPPEHRRECCWARLWLQRGWKSALSRKFTSCRRCQFGLLAALLSYGFPQPQALGDWQHLLVINKWRIADTLNFSHTKLAHLLFNIFLLKDSQFPIRLEKLLVAFDSRRQANSIYCDSKWGESLYIWWAPTWKRACKSWSIETDILLQLGERGMRVVNVA